MLKDADKETIETQQRKLMEARAELEDLKQKFALMKQKFDSISNYAAKDHQEFVTVSKDKKAFEEMVAKLKVQNQELLEKYEKIKLQYQELKKKPPTTDIES